VADRVVHRRGGRLARGGPKRETTWIGISASRTAFVAGGGTLIASLNAGALSLRPFTIVRTHLFLGIQSDQTAATENQLAAFGMAVVSDQATAAGVASIPTPDTNVDSEFWFVHQYLGAAFVVASAIGESPDALQWMRVDSKAMRKVDRDEDIVVVGEFATGLSDGFSLTVAGRMLVKLH